MILKIAEFIFERMAMYVLRKHWEQRAKDQFFYWYENDYGKIYFIPSLKQ